MRPERKKDYPAVQLGSSMMLVVLIILCLTAFATLSLSSALRDSKFSQQTAKKNTAYYQADLKAGKKLKEIAAALKLGDADSTQDALLKINDISIHGDTVSYEIPMDERQNLQVELLLNDSNDLYKITCWKEVPSTQWNGDTTLPVMGNE